MCLQLWRRMLTRAHPVVGRVRVGGGADRCNDTMAPMKWSPQDTRGRDQCQGFSLTPFSAWAFVSKLSVAAGGVSGITREQ